MSAHHHLAPKALPRRLYMLTSAAAPRQMTHAHQCQPLRGSSHMLNSAAAADACSPLCHLPSSCLPTRHHTSPTGIPSAPPDSLPPLQTVSRSVWASGCSHAPHTHTLIVRPPQPTFTVRVTAGPGCVGPAPRALPRPHPVVPPRFPSFPAAGRPSDSNHAAPPHLLCPRRRLPSLFGCLLSS